MNPFLLYQFENSRTKLEVRLEGATVWLSKQQFTFPIERAERTITHQIKQLAATCQTL